VSASRRADLLLRLYPREWRTRYGAELEELISQASSGRGPGLRASADLVASAFRERLHAAGLAGDGPPGARVRGGALLVLWAWLLFVLAGLSLQKLSEHWQASVSSAARAYSSTAFDVLVVTATLASGLVLVAAATALPSLVPFLRAGGWPQLRRLVLTSVAITACALAATIVLVGWAHGLDERQRNGHDLAYAAGFLGWAVVVAACLTSWTATAAAVLRRIDLSAGRLRLDAWIAAAVTAAMALMTALTIVWWAELPARAPMAGPDARLALTVALMLAASSLGAVGAARALRASPGLD
jgi:hypothetical protein